MKYLIIYDLDGTLVDTRKDIADAANHMLHQLARPSLSVAEISGYVGRGLDQLIRGCLKTDDSLLLEQAKASYRGYYAAHLLDHSRLYPGSREILEYFRMRKQAVFTNKPNPFSSDILIRLCVMDYFCELITGDAAYPKKPDPAAVFAIMDKTKVKAQDTVFVGDSPLDVETGRAAGVLTIGIAQGFATKDELVAANPDVLLDNLHELLDLAKRQEW